MNQLFSVPRAGLIEVIVFVGVCLVFSHGDAFFPTKTVQQQRIVLIIRDRSFLVAEAVPIQVGEAVEIVLRNQDTVRHGFASSSLQGLLVSGEDDQIATYGTGVEGFYVNPGRTLIIRFVAERPGSFHFHCDLHKEMKGELYMLEVPTV